MIPQKQEKESESDRGNVYLFPPWREAASRQTAPHTGTKGRSGAGYTRTPPRLSGCGAPQPVSFPSSSLPPETAPASSGCWGSWVKGENPVPRGTGTRTWRTLSLWGRCPSDPSGSCASSPTPSEFLQNGPGSDQARYIRLEPTTSTTTTTKTVTTTTTAAATTTTVRRRSAAAAETRIATTTTTTTSTEATTKTTTTSPISPILFCSILDCVLPLQDPAILLKLSLSFAVLFQGTA